MAKMLMAAFENAEDANAALYELEHFGYTPQQISVISNSNKYQVAESEHGSRAVGSAGTGAATGGIVGGLAGLMAGVGIIPAIAGFFIGGPIAAVLGLAGAAATTVSGAVTGAAAGGLIGALTGLGVPKHIASTYDETITSGGVVLGLSGHEESTEEARTILENHGAGELQVIEMAGDEASLHATHPTEMRDRDMQENNMQEDAHTSQIEDAYNEPMATTRTETHDHAYDAQALDASHKSAREMAFGERIRYEGDDEEAVL